MPTESEAWANRPLLDIASYGRRARDSHARLTRDEIEHIRRTVTGTPEVMIKVLTRGGQSLGAIQRHLSYLDRGGRLDLETDEQARVAGSVNPKSLVEGWDLDLEEDRSGSALSPTNQRQSPKLVHKLIFSMPPGTPPQKVLAAVRAFAREEFALRHRYAMVLHTDEPHPHVHVVVKAISEQGERLNIRKATLRAWRVEFAKQLRLQSVAANATERAVRGEPRNPKLDGIYRAERRGASTHTRRRTEKVAEMILSGISDFGLNPTTLAKTRKSVRDGWRATEELLDRHGDSDLVSRVRHFTEKMKAPETENQRLQRILSDSLNRHRDSKSRGR